MARSSADDMDLRRQCDAAINSGGGKQKVVLSMRTAKSHGVWGKSGLLGRQMAKPRVLAISTESKGQITKVFIRVLKYSTRGDLEAAKLYKLKHLTKVEVIQNDPSGCTFTLGFDNLRSQSVSPPQWTMRNKDDRNRFLICILNMCKEILARLPKVVGIDIVEMALWAKANTPAMVNQVNIEVGPVASVIVQSDSQVTVERDLVSQAEEEDLEALLGTYVLQGLEMSTICIEDMDERLGIFNVKLIHMREDIESIESRNNKLEVQSVSNKALLEELDKLLERLCIPSEFAALLTSGSFDQKHMLKNIEACEWLTGALRTLEVPNLDPIYANMRAVKEKRVDLEKMKSMFVRRASEFLRNYFSSLVEFMLNDKRYFSQRGVLKRPDHADLRYKSRTCARLLQHLKGLDRNSLGAFRKAYCQSLNLLLRREAREFSNELRASTRVSRNLVFSFEALVGSSQMANTADTSAVSEAYSKMLTVFIPLLVDESSFFAHFMCFEVPSLVTFGNQNGSEGIDTADDKTTVTDPNRNDVKLSNRSSELGKLNECLHELLDGIQEDFFAVVDWACKVDPMFCISMHAVTERYLSGQKADAAGFVRLLLGELESRISMLFGKFVEEVCLQIERSANVRQMGVLAYIPKFATLATRMELYTQGNSKDSRDLVDQAYTKIVSIMFVTLEKASQVDSKYADIILLENYAAFQHSLYDLANVVPTLAKFYHQASESYEQACTRHINMVIYIIFEKLFQFARRLEELNHQMTQEEIPFQVGMSKVDLRKTLKSGLAGIEKTFNALYRKLIKNITTEELYPTLWDKCKDFMDKFDSFTKLVAKIYPTEAVPSAGEMRDVLASM